MIVKPDNGGPASHVSAAPEPIGSGPAASEGSGRDPVDDYIYLIGRPTLRQFLDFVKHRSRDGRRADLGLMTDEWREAARRVLQLETEEAGAADRPAIQSLPKSMESLRQEFMRDPLVQHGYNTFPTQLGVVELDRLTVFQPHIDLSFVRLLKTRLGPAPGPEEVFRFCLPFDHPEPPVRWARSHHDTYVFTSPSNDLRFLGCMALQPENVSGYPLPGVLVGVLGLAVGFCSNFLSLICVDDRLIMHNGSHRAYTLRELGITHAPALIQHVYSREEFNTIASSAVLRQGETYLKHRRPPMLKDYFDPRLHKVIPVIRRLRQVTVKFQVDEAYVPVL